MKPPSFLKRLMVDRVIGMVNDSTSRLEKAYPTVFQIYKTFKTGDVLFVCMHVFVLPRVCVTVCVCACVHACVCNFIAK